MEPIESQEKDRKPPSPRFFVYILAAILVGSIAHYFFISLPAHNAALLQLERERFEAEEQRKAAAAAAEESERERAASNRRLLRICTEGAEDAYWDLIKLNGRETPGKPGNYTAPRWVWEHADKEKEAALDECYRTYK